MNIHYKGAWYWRWICWVLGSHTWKTVGVFKPRPNRVNDNNLSYWPDDEVCCICQAESLKFGA